MVLIVPLQARAPKVMALNPVRRSVCAYSDGPVEGVHFAFSYLIRTESHSAIDVPDHCTSFTISKFREKLGTGGGCEGTTDDQLVSLVVSPCD
jgi:hypothetical protein